MVRRFFYSPGFIIFVVTCASFTDIFLCDFIVASLPNLIRDRAGVPSDQVQVWMSGLMSSFGVGLVVALPIVGWFTDHCKDRKLPFTCGLITLCLATLAFFAATAAPVMVAARFLQGCSAAFIMSSGMAFVTETVPADRAPNAIGWVTSAQAVGEITGIVAGGVLYDFGGHRVMAITAMVLVLCDVGLRLLVRSPPSGKSVLEADSEHHTPSESSPLLPGQEHERKRLRPAVLELLLHKDFVLTLVACFFIRLIRQALETDLPFMLQQRYGWPPSLASVALLGFMAPATLSPLYSRATIRYGPRFVLVLVSAILTFVLIGASFARDANLASKVVLCISIVLLGALTSFLFVATMTASTRVVEWARHSPRFGPQGAAGQVFSLLILSGSAGNVCGPIWLAIMQRSAGWSVSYISMAAFSVTTAVVMCFSSNGRR